MDRASDIATLKLLGPAFRGGYATPEQTADFLAANDRHMQRSLTASSERQPGWWNLPIAKACWEGDARDLEGC